MMPYDDLDDLEAWAEGYISTHHVKRGKPSRCAVPGCDGQVPGAGGAYTTCHGPGFDGQPRCPKHEREEQERWESVASPMWRHMYTAHGRALFLALAEGPCELYPLRDRLRERTGANWTRPGLVAELKQLSRCGEAKARPPIRGERREYYLTEKGEFLADRFLELDAKDPPARP